MDTGGNSLPSPSCVDGKKRRVCYYYDPGIAHIKLSDEHVMVPARVAMAHSLVGAYGMLGDMRRLRTRPASEAEIRRFHSPEYVDLLRDLTPESYNDGLLRLKAAKEEECHGFGGCTECPPFDRLWDYCRGYAGGSLAAARALVGGASDVAINWSGGMHHACADKASGFCYVNDIVLAIDDLLGAFRRVIYVDIDAHHGDGVQEAFVDSDRVMTLSFHRYGKTRQGEPFFPGTGLVDEIGVGAGEHYSVNVPLDAGVRDDVYLAMFKPIVGKAMEVFDPEAIVLQCGADSLSGDRLGGMELSVRGHAECVSFLRGFNRPLLLLGGGGYTINHVASSWCYETAVAIGKEEELPNEIPKHGYDLFYKNQGNMLHYSESTATVSKKSLQKASETKQSVLEHLSQIKAVPSVQFQGRRRGNAATGVDVGDLYYERPPSLEEDEPMQRMHRLCNPVGQGKRIKLN